MSAKRIAHGAIQAPCDVRLRIPPLGSFRETGPCVCRLLCGFLTGNGAKLDVLPDDIPLVQNSDVVELHRRPSATPAGAEGPH